jgi:acylphosphatase
MFGAPIIVSLYSASCEKIPERTQLANNGEASALAGTALNVTRGTIEVVVVGDCASCATMVALSSSRLQLPATLLAQVSCSISRE